MSEFLPAITEGARIIGRGVLDAVLERWDRADTSLADALNPPEVDYPRFYVDQAEAPVATEDEL